MSASNKSVQKLRLEIAQIAAHLVAVDGVNDYITAKRKAAQRLGISAGKHMPTNHEVEQALINYQTLFQTDFHLGKLSELRNCALKAMQFLQQFEPRLVGPVLSGTATEHSVINLHLFSDEIEQIGFFLEQHAIPYSNCEKTVKIKPGETHEYPAIRFIAEGKTLMLIIFPEKNIKSSPLSSITGRPMQRANIEKVLALIEQSA